MDLVWRLTITLLQQRSTQARRPKAYANSWNINILSYEDIFVLHAPCLKSKRLQPTVLGQHPVSCRDSGGEEWLRPFLRSACVYSVDNECVTVQEQEQGNERPGERGRQKESSSLHYIVTRAKIDHRAWSHAEKVGSWNHWAG